MGRIKGIIIKRTAREIMEKYKDQLSNNFEKNKLAIAQFNLSKKTRNSVAGYITRKVKKAEIAEKGKKLAVK